MRTNHAGTGRCGRCSAAAVAAGAIVVLWVAPASAHVTAEPAEQLPGGLGTVGLRVPHGCGDSATTRIDVAVPEGLEAVEALPHEGWVAATTNGPDGSVEQVSWSGGPLPSEAVTTFRLRARLPETPGTRLWFKVVQTCEQGQLRWVQIPSEGERVESLPYPAAWVDLVGPGTSQADRDVAAGRAFGMLSGGGVVAAAGGALLALRLRPSIRGRARRGSRRKG